MRGSKVKKIRKAARLVSNDPRQVRRVFKLLKRNQRRGGQ